jgi:hypothetical protein
VDFNARDGVLAPDTDGDEESLRLVIDHIHQIGWQLRLGEHIVAKQQEESARAIPPPAEDDIARTRQTLVDAGVGESMLEGICDALAQGRDAIVLNNNGYRHRLRSPESNPFATLGQRGYEAQTRELQRMAEEIGLRSDTDGLPPTS